MLNGEKVSFTHETSFSQVASSYGNLVSVRVPLMFHLLVSEFDAPGVITQPLGWHGFR